MDRLSVQSSRFGSLPADYPEPDADSGIPIVHIPNKLQKELAQHLDVGTENTWVDLAERFGLDCLTISAINNRCPAGGWTMYLFGHHGGHVTVEDLQDWLKEIGNLSAWRALSQHYENIRNNYRSYLERIQNISSAEGSSEATSEVRLACQRMASMHVTEEQMQRRSLVAPSRSFHDIESERDYQEGTLKIFVSCSDDGLQLCKNMCRWLTNSKKGNFSVLYPDRCHLSMAVNMYSWAERKLQQADFVVLLVTNGYSKDVQTTAVQSGSLSAVTRYVYELMRLEFVDSGCRHYRSVPVLAPDVNRSHVPSWFNSTVLYTWPTEHEKLFQVFCSRCVKKC